MVVGSTGDRSLGGSMLRVLVAALALAAFAGCGGGSSDSAGTDSTSTADERTDSKGSGGTSDSKGSSPTEPEGGAETPEVTEEVCEAAAPLFKSLEKNFYIDDEVVAIRAQAVAALAKVAELSDGETAEAFRDCAEKAKAEGATWFPREAMKRLAGCAEGRLDVVVSDDGIADLPATVPAGLTALSVSNPGEDIAYIVLPAAEGEDAQDLLDQVEFEIKSQPISFSTRSQDGSVVLFVLKPGRYGLLVFPAPEEGLNGKPEVTGPEFVRIFEAE